MANFEDELMVIELLFAAAENNVDNIRHLVAQGVPVHAGDYDLRTALHLAAAEGMKPNVYNLIFTLLLAGVIALSIKMIGTLLITGLLIIPAAASRNITNNPKQMVFVAILIGILSVIIGLFTSLGLNTSSGPSIIVIALVLFVASLIPLELRGRLQK